MRLFYFIIGLFLFVTNLFAQEYRCDLCVKDSIQFRVPIPQCWEPDELNGQTFTVPKNVTRIDYDGLAICLPFEVDVIRPADVVFVLDWSGSMTGMDRDWNVPKVARKAMEYLHQVSPASTGGFIGFARANCDSLAPKPLTDATHYQNLLEKTNYSRDATDCWGTERSTNYYAALSLARRWLDNPNISPNSKKAIIFLTDGEPRHQVSEYESLVRENGFPPIFAIYLGGDYETLREITSLTGGAFYVGDPSNPEYLQEIYYNIITHLTQRRRPVTVTVTNSANNQVSYADENDFQVIQRGSWGFNLDSIVALQEGPNEIELSYIIENDTTGLSDTNVINFTVDVSGDVIQSDGNHPIGNSLFQVKCYPVSQLFYTSTNYEVNFTRMPPIDIGYGLKLVTAPSNHNLDSVTFTQNTSITADRENAFRAAFNQRRTQFEVGTELRIVSSGGAVPDNRMTEGILSDTIRTEWMHPRDPRDRAAATIVIENIEFRGAFTRDADANGYLDGIVLHFNVPIDPAKIDFKSLLAARYGDVSFKIDTTNMPHGLIGQEDTLIVIEFIQHTSGPMQTGWKPDITINAPEIKFPDGSKVVNYTAADSAGPVIQKAYLKIGNPESPYDDTLLITFSEKVQWPQGGAPPDDIFNLYVNNQDNSSTEAFQNLAIADIVVSDTGAVIYMRNGFTITPFDDYVQLERGDRNEHVHDIAGNHGPRRGRRTQIVTDAWFKIYSVPNPFDPENSIVPDAVKGMAQNRFNVLYGTVIVVKTSQTVIDCKVSIYDMLGNVLLEDAPLIRDAESINYYAVWDGRNLNSRIVGKGVYLAIITAKVEQTGQKLSEKLKIGVK